MLTSCVKCNGARFIRKVHAVKFPVDGHTFDAFVEGDTCVTCGNWYLDGAEHRRLERAIATDVMRWPPPLSPKARRFVRRAFGRPRSSAERF